MDSTCSCHVSELEGFLPGAFWRAASRIDSDVFSVFSGGIDHEVAQNLTARNVNMGPKPTEPDHWRQRPHVGTGRTIMQEITALVLTRSTASKHRRNTTSVHLPVLTRSAPAGFHPIDERLAIGWYLDNRSKSKEIRKL